MQRNHLERMNLIASPFCFQSRPNVAQKFRTICNNHVNNLTQALKVVVNTNTTDYSLQRRNGFPQEVREDTCPFGL